MLKFFPKSSVANTLFPALPSAQAASVLALQYELLVSERLSFEDLTALQFKQLRLMLAYASKHSPYAKKLFAEQPLPEVLDQSFLQTLPILTRDKVKALADKLYCEAAPKEHGKCRIAETSGSTSTPVKVKVTEIYDFYWRAFALRDHAWHQRDISKHLAAIRWAANNIGQAPNGAKKTGWGAITDVAFKTGPSSFLSIATPLEEQWKWLEKTQPEYLLSFPSNLAALAEYCLAHNYQLPSLLQLRTIGETLTDEQRQLFHKAWGVKTVDCYTCEESGYIALQCPEHEHYHVQSENVIVEIVDDNGKPCAVGEPGRVLITSLQNFATPLIRYELGDLAEWGEPCDCGRTLPVIKKIHGRKRSRLTLPDGRSEFPYLGEHGEILALIGRSPDEIQYVQTTVNDVLVRLKISPALNKDEEALIAAKVVENFGYAFNISFEHHDKPLPRNRRGKFEYFVNQVNS